LIAGIPSEMHGKKMKLCAIVSAKNIKEHGKGCHFPRFFLSYACLSACSLAQSPCLENGKEISSTQASSLSYTITTATLLTTTQTCYTLTKAVYNPDLVFAFQAPMYQALSTVIQTGCKAAIWLSERI